MNESGKLSPLRLLLAVDGSEHSRVAARLLHDLPLPMESVMTARHRTPWLTLLVVIGIVVSACVGATAPDGGSVTQPSPASTLGADGSLPAVPGPLDAELAPIDRTGDLLLAAAQAEIAGRAGSRERAEMTTYLGPDAQILADALDLQASDLLRRLAEEVTGGRSGTRVAMALIPGEPSLPDPIRQPTGRAGLPPPGLTLLGPWVTALSMVDEAVGRTKPYQRDTSDSKEVEVGSSKGTVKTDVSITITPSGSKVTIEVEVKSSGQVVDATGQLLFRIEGVGKAHIEVEACPDTAGLAPATMQFTSQEDYFVGGERGRFGQSQNIAMSGDAKIYANDAAEIDRTEVEIRADESTKGGTRVAGAGLTDLMAYAVGVAISATIPRTGAATFGGAEVTSVDSATEAQALDLFRRTGFVQFAAMQSAQAAEKAWRSGRCIEVVVDPAGGDVDPDSVTSVTAKVRHKFEGNELDKPVEATLNGVKSIDPAGQKQPAPATFTYTAGPKSGDKGELRFESVSNRGIGETTVTFTVRPGGWIYGGGLGIATGKKCDGLGGKWVINIHFQLGEVDMSQVWVATIDEKTLTGTYTYDAIQTGHGATGTWHGTGGVASLIVEADGSVAMTLKGGQSTLTIEVSGATSTTTVPDPVVQFPWEPAGDACNAK